MKQKIETCLMRAIRSVGMAIAIGGLAMGAHAQEESVKPGINASFENPNVDSFIKRFEIESRAIFRNRNEIIDALGLEAGMDVADVGAGTGFFTRMIAPKVGPEGKVYAVDIAENFVEHIAKSSKEDGLNNIVAVLCEADDSKLAPESVDLVFICDVYHHFEFPHKTMATIQRALRPGGRLVIVDFERVVGTSAEWTLGHVRCGKGTVTDEVKDAGFDYVDEVELMKEQYIRRFKKRAPREE